MLIDVHGSVRRVWVGLCIGDSAHSDGTKAFCVGSIASKLQRQHLHF